jgi:hypothetical protein
MVGVWGRERGAIAPNAATGALEPELTSMIGSLPILKKK